MTSRIGGSGRPPMPATRGQKSFSDDLIPADRTGPSAESACGVTSCSETIRGLHQKKNELTIVNIPMVFQINSSIPMICHVWVFGGQRKGHSKCSLERTARRSSVSSIPICSISWSSGNRITLEMSIHEGLSNPAAANCLVAMWKRSFFSLLVTFSAVQMNALFPYMTTGQTLNTSGLILEIDPGSPYGPLFHRTHSQSSGRMSLPRSSMRPSDSRSPIASRV